MGEDSTIRWIADNQGNNRKHNPKREPTRSQQEGHWILFLVDCSQSKQKRIHVPFFFSPDLSPGGRGSQTTKLAKRGSTT